MTTANNQPQTSQKGNFAVGMLSNSTMNNQGVLAGSITTNNIYGETSSCFYQLTEEDLIIDLEYPYSEANYLHNFEKLKQESSEAFVVQKTHILFLDREIGDPTSLKYASLGIANLLHHQGFKVFHLNRNKENLNSIDYSISKTAQENSNSKLLFILDDITSTELFNAIKPDVIFPKIKNPSNIFILITSRDNVENWGEKIKAYRAQISRISPSSISPQQIEQFYGVELTYREKLLCLGLTFFDGLPEDQFFAALEDVVTRAWQKRDPSLKALDYCDIQNLYQKYFGFLKDPYQISYNTPLKVVEPQVYRLDIYSIGVSDSDLRLALFRTAWKRDSEYSLRRQIISAISVLVSLVVESVSIQNTILKWELYGSEERQLNLRRVIANAFRDLGQVSSEAIEAVQSALVQLGNHNDDRVREVAAQAASGWYASEKYHLKFFRTLENLYGLAFAFEEQHKELNQQLPFEERTDYINSLGATVALCLKHAVQYDPPNYLNSILVNWLQELSQLDNPEVQRCLRAQTLPIATAFHLNQLYTDGILQEILNLDIYFAIAIAQGVAQSFYKGQGDVALDLLNTWHQDYCHAYTNLKLNFGNWSKPNFKTKDKSATPTDTTPPCKLVVVNLARAFFDYDILGEDILSFESSAQIVLHAFTVKTRENIRDFALVAALLLFNQNIEKLKKYFEDLLSELSISRRQSAIQLVLDIYRDSKLLDTVNKILNRESSQKEKQLQEASEFIGLAQKIKLGSSQFYTSTKENRIDMDALIYKTFLEIKKLSEIPDKNSKLRKAVILAFQIAASSHFNNFMKGFESGQWQQPLESDRVLEFLASIFLEVYLDQRSSLTQDGSITIVKHDGCDYPVWRNRERPLTAIEKYLLNWIQSHENIGLKKLGLQCFIEFAKNAKLF